MAERSDDARITALAAAAGAGDRVALAEFVRSTQRDVHRFVAHLAGAADADDIAQDTFRRAMRSLPQFEGRSSARTWLLSIARRAAADAVRTAVRRPRTTAVEDWETLGATRPRSASDEAVVLRSLVDALDPERREAFVLTQVLDLSYAEAADMCGCPLGTIRSRVARAREDLVAAMTESPRSRRASGG